ncbi:MAG TPA: TonB family protein [Usitatibacter sp.]|nr:TonB family protein [Usitatibacter sp.]
MPGVPPGTVVLERASATPGGSLGHWYLLDGDCRPIGETRVQVVAKPAHGRLDTEIVTARPLFEEESALKTCNARKVPQTRLRYYPEAGYVGDDDAQVDILYGDGSVKHVLYRIAVWPIPFTTKYAPLPDYPEAVRAKGIEGRVRACLYVNSQGEVDRVAIKWSTSDLLARAVEAATSKWKYEPPSRRHTSAHIIADQDFVFHLEDDVRVETH